MLPIAALAESPPRVLVSLKPIHSLVAGLLAGVTEPELIIDHGSPWDWTAAPELTRSLDEADLVIWLGPEIEPALSEVITAHPLDDRGLELLSATELKVLPSRKGAGRDPFIWLDTRNMLILVDLLTDRLGRLDPLRAHRYQTNRRDVLKQLSQLDRELEYGYKDVSASPVFLYQDTQQYFEQAYAMKTAGIASSPDGIGETSELLEMRGRLTGAERACLFTEAGLSAPHLDLLSAAPGVKVVELDSLGMGLAPGPALYEKLMRNHFEHIRDCIAPDALPAVMPAADKDVELYSHRIQAKYLLMNHFGETVSNLDFSGSYQLVYFGYTFCPDICPTSLAAMAQALKTLGPKAERIQPLFITVDPARDTLEVLRRYTGYFHPRLIGLTGPEAMIARTADQFRVRYEKVEKPDQAPDRYAMDHTASLFLLGPDSEFIAKFAHGIPAGVLASRLDDLIKD